MNTPEPTRLDALECGLTEEEVRLLTRDLRLHRQQHAHDGAFTDWSWTRLQARLRQNHRPSPALVFWRWAAATSMAALALFLVLQIRNPVPQSPVAETQNPRLWASGYHFPSAQADVIWATGYDYIPASYSVK